MRRARHPRAADWPPWRTSGRRLVGRRTMGWLSAVKAWLRGEASSSPPSPPPSSSSAGAGAGSGDLRAPPDWRTGRVLVVARRSLSVDEDGDVAHGFLEERREVGLVAVADRLRPVGAVPLSKPRCAGAPSSSWSAAAVARASAERGVRWQQAHGARFAAVARALPSWPARERARPTRPYRGRRGRGRGRGGGGEQQAAAVSRRELWAARLALHPA